MDYFSISKKTPLAIYGLSNIGRQKCQALTDAGYRVLSIIDRNAERLPTFCGIPALTVDGFCRKFPDREEMAVIVCLNNGMQHEAAAGILASHGYDRILYIPMDEKGGYPYLSAMQHAYSAFLDGRFNSLDKIPIYSGRHDRTSGEIQILSTDGGNVTFLCEIEYLFSPDEKMIWESSASEYILRNALENPEYIDRPLAMCKNYSNLYDYAMGIVPYPGLYMRYFGRDEEYNRTLLEDRLCLFNCYEQRYAANIQLFYLQPASAEWNPKGYFNIRDGMHRAMFLYYVKNHFKIPVKSRRASFEEFQSRHKETDCIYKSRQLVLQERLSEYFDIYGSKGAVVGGGKDYFTTELLKKMSKDVVFLKEIRECLDSKNRFDYIFVHPSLLSSRTAEIPSEIFYIAPRLLFEYSENLPLKVRDLLADAKAEKVGSVLGKDFKRTYFYLLERKRNE